MWILFAFCSALCAAIMSILIKTTLKNVGTMTSLTIRTIIVAFMGIIISFFIKENKGLKGISGKDWIWMIITSIVTFLTWYFYYLAMNKGTVTKVMAIDKLSLVFALVISVVFLHEKITLISLIGYILIIIGCIVILFT